jgi:hypothetical protein
MIAPYTLILTPNELGKGWPPQKTPQNDGYFMSVDCNTTNSLKYKKRRIRRRRMVEKR